MVDTECSNNVIPYFQTMHAQYVEINQQIYFSLNFKSRKNETPLLTGCILLQAKKDIYQVKSQRLMLAQDEYNHLNNELATLTTSRTSCKYWKNRARKTIDVKFSVCSTTSIISTKYDPDLLKSDVAMAKNRVSRLKSELEQIRNEMNFTQRGVETLAK